jgi:amino acid transporter
MQLTTTTFAKRLNLPETLAMSVALMAPTTGMVFVTPFLAAVSGYNVPLAFVISLLGVLIIGFSFGRLGKTYVHAGSAYGLTKDALGSTAGVFAGWGLTLTYTLLTAALLAGTGEFANLAIAQVTGIQISWVVLALIAAAVVLWFAINNIRVSMRMMLLLEGLSMALIVVVSALIIGHSHLTATTAVQPFILNDKGVVGIAEAMVFGLTSFLGFEGAATLGEESKDPKRMVPLAIMFSALVGGVFFIFVAYSQTVGFGFTADGVNKFSTDAAPMNTLVQRYLGNTFSAMINVGAAISFFACAVAAVNGNSRIVFALSRDRYLPRPLAKLHDATNTPRSAVYLVFTIALALLGLGVALFQSPSNVLGYLSGLGTFGALVAYGLVVFASLKAYWRSDLRERKVLSMALPVIGLGLIGYVIYGSVYPVPAAPVNFFPYIVLCYFAVVVTFSLIYRRRTSVVDLPKSSMEMGVLQHVAEAD